MRQQPPNREIGFVSSSFSFRAVRAGGRGEAAWVRRGRYPQRWAFRVLVSTCVCVCSRAVGVNYLLTGVRVLKVFARFCLARPSQIAIPPAGFKVLGAAHCCYLLIGVRVPRFLVCCFSFFADRRAGSKVFGLLLVVLC